LLGWPRSSPLTPDHGDGDAGWAWGYLGLIAAAFAVYVLALALLARGSRARTPGVLALAAAIQLSPLAAPVLLSTDVYTYWDYGRLSAVHGENPYAVEPLTEPQDPAFARMGADWRETTSVYGPVFTLSSEAHALAVGDSPEAAAWGYKALAALAVVVIAWLAARVAARPPLAAAFAGWNPLLAVHFAGGGHNDAWMMALVVAALALAAAGRRQVAGAGWALAIGVKWVAVVFLPLRALEAWRSGRRVGHVGFGVAAAVVIGVACWRYGGAWLDAFGPVSRNFREGSSYSLPSRLESLRVPHGAAIGIFAGLFVVAYLWLAREAWRGRARLGLAAGLLMATAPWLVPWYTVWTVPLAAIEEDRAARLLALGLCAYLLPQTVPL
jgi:hypothetical protein